jgi:hypothetical protein
MVPVRSVIFQPEPLGRTPVFVQVPWNDGGMPYTHEYITGEPNILGARLSSRDEVRVRASAAGGQVARQDIVGVEGTAHITFGSRASDWSFGFIQFMRFNVLDATYRGTERGDGETYLQWFSGNEQTLLLLDKATNGSDPTGPWYSTLTTLTAGSVRQGAIPIRWNDSPVQSIPLQTVNHSGGRQRVNYLHHVWHRSEFTTVLAAMEPRHGRLHALVWFDWMVDWDLNFRRDSAATFHWELATNHQGKVVDRPTSGQLIQHQGIQAIFASRSSQIMPPLVSTIVTFDPQPGRQTGRQPRRSESPNWH